MAKSKSRFLTGFQNMFQYLNNNIIAINESKLFAGIMIIILNIASKFVTINLSKTMESYLKFTFSRDVLIFAITWMGTRDIYISIIMTLFFIIFVDFLFNEESTFCILPESFTGYHISKLDDNTQVPTDDDVQKALLTIKKYELGKKNNLENITKPMDNKIIDNNFMNSNISGY